MVQLQRDLEEIEATGTQVVGVSYDSVEILKAFSDSAGITFQLLSDPDSTIIEAYGIYHKDGYPHPGTYLIGQDGTVLAELFFEGYKKRHGSAELIEAANAAGQ